MWQNISNRYFWFSQPSSFLSNEDRMFFYLFAALVVLGIIVRIVAWLTKHSMRKKVLLKFWNLLFYIGLSGLIWFAFRYENTYIFGNRYWAGLTIISGLVWLGFILKYLFFGYRKQKSEYEQDQLRNKYLPKSR